MTRITISEGSERVLSVSINTHIKPNGEQRGFYVPEGSLVTVGGVFRSCSRQDTSYRVTAQLETESGMKTVAFFVSDEELY